MTTDSTKEFTTVAMLGLGEAGTAIATGLAREWRDADPARRILAVDIALGDNIRGPAINDRARAIGVDIAGTYTPALAAAGFVVSVVTGVEAMNAALAARPILRPGTLYLDVNTLTGKQTVEIAAKMEEAGIAYVDVAAMGGFNALGHKAPLLLAGPAAERAAAWMRPHGFEVRVLSERAGDASAVKIIRSVMMKGIEALSVECLVTAYRQGLVAEVLDCFADVDAMSFRNFVREMAITHPAHARRRMEEVDKVIENLRETGVEPLMSERTRQSHARTVAADIAPADGGKPELEEALALLSEKVVKGLG